jgi:hypothetical protein
VAGGADLAQRPLVPIHHLRVLLCGNSGGVGAREGGPVPSMQFTATRLRVDHDEHEPNVTAGDLEITCNDRGKTSWAVTIVTDEPWHHGRGECRLLIEVDRNHRLQGRAVLIRSDRERWHYFEGAGNLGAVVIFNGVT